MAYRKLHGFSADDIVVPGWLVTLAKLNKQPLECFDDVIIAGDMMIPKVTSRYPNWRQVIPQIDSYSTPDTDALLKECKQKIARSKIDDGNDLELLSVKIDLGSGVTAVMNAKYMLAALQGSKGARLSWRQADVKDGRLVSSPLVVTHGDHTEVIMPMDNS